MSSEWPSITFSEAPFLIIDGDRGTNYPKQHEFTSSGHCLFLNAGNVTKEGFAFSECAFISEEKDLLLRKGKLQRHDIVLTTRGTVGNVAYYSDNVEFGHIRINSGMVIFRPDPTQILPYYLYLFLRSNNFDEQVKSLTSGSAQPQLPIRDMNRIVIPLPSIEVQAEICLTLGGLDDRIALLRETNVTLEAIAQALFKSWFVDFDPVHANAGTQTPSLPADIQALFPSRLVESPQGLIPEGWEVFRLGDVTERITKGTTPTTLKKAFTDVGINFVKVESLTENGEFITDKFSFIDDETHQLLKRSQLKSGDVLVTIAGTIGRVAEVTEDIIPANTNQAVALIRPIQQKLPSGLIRRFLQRNDSKQHMGERVVQAVQANLSLGSLSDMAVVVPPEAVVGKLYALAFEHIDTSKNNNMRQIKTLTNLRDTLLPRLISGQLRLPDAEAAIAEVV
jgi:type I restriction enzyme S subunit